MAKERFGSRSMSDARPAVRRAPDRTVQGSFAMPAADSSLEDQPRFVFDDEPLWEQPVNGLAVRTDAPRHTQTKPPQNREPQRSGGQKGGWKAYLYVAVITLSLLGMIVLGIVMMPQLFGYFWKDFGNFAFVNGELLSYDPTNVAVYKQYRSYMNRDVIYPGVFVDGVHVGDMTIDQAREALSGETADLSAAFSVTVAIGDKTWTLDPSNVPVQRDLGNVLQKAYAIGRTNTTEIQTTMQTPFRQRANTAAALRTSGVNLTTSASYDQEAVKSIVAEIAAYVTRDPIDAQIQSFDYNTRTFTFTDSQPGVTLDQDVLYERITEALDKWEKGVTVTAEPIITQPSVTTEQMKESFNLIAAYTTQTTRDSNRNTNISLACQAINGTALMPGETFSFNKTTGQRTTEKGYQSAGAIAAGQSIEEVGGGICQVSSTLFNAVARANLEIVSRSPHAWPSTYVNIGEDATVNWPNLDFQFKNNTSSPVFIITYYKDRKMSAEIWGMSLGEGVSIDLESSVVRTMDPPSEAKYVYNAELAYGDSKTTVKSRTGYVVETYKVWYKDGVETGRELLHTSTYKAYQQVIEYNW